MQLWQITKFRDSPVRWAEELTDILQEWFDQIDRKINKATPDWDEVQGLRHDVQELQEEVGRLHELLGRKAPIMGEGNGRVTEPDARNV